MTYTPGPWRVLTCAVGDVDGRPHFEPWFDIEADDPDLEGEWLAVARLVAMEADARLIAAAPTLYEALKRIVALSEDDEHEPTYAWKDAFEAAAAALAIAEGETH